MGNGVMGFFSFLPEEAHCFTQNSPIGGILNGWNVRSQANCPSESEMNASLIAGECYQLGLESKTSTLAPPAGSEDALSLETDESNIPNPFLLRARYSNAKCSIPLEGVYSVINIPSVS